MAAAKIAVGACRNSILGVFGIFLAKNSFQSSKFSEGIFLHGLCLVILCTKFRSLASQPV
jgi:hypothetical protein